MHRTVRLNAIRWRELLRSFALPLLLVLAQQGAVLHELSHYSATERHDSKKQSPRGDVCDLCLAFAQVGSGAPAKPVAALQLADLSHQLTPAVPVYAGTTHVPAERSRGPPLFL